MVRTPRFHCLGPSPIPRCQGTKIPQAAWCSQKQKKIIHVNLQSGKLHFNDSQFHQHIYCSNLLSSSSCLPVPFILCLTCKTQLTFIQFHLMQKVSMELIYSLPLFSIHWLRWVLDAVQAFSGCGEQGLLLLEVCRALTAAAPLAAEHGLQGECCQWPGSCGSLA